LGDETKNRNDPISSVAPPKVAKARTMVTVACHCRLHYRAKLRQRKHRLWTNVEQGISACNEKTL